MYKHIFAEIIQGVYSFVWSLEKNILLFCDNCFYSDFIEINPFDVYA